MLRLQDADYNASHRCFRTETEFATAISLASKHVVKFAKSGSSAANLVGSFDDLAKAGFRKNDKIHIAWDESALFSASLYK